MELEKILKDFKENKIDMEKRLPQLDKVKGLHLCNHLEMFLDIDIMVS